MTEQEIVDRIKAKKREMETAGYIHKRDLIREVRRLERELRTYRYFQKNYKKRQRLPA